MGAEATTARMAGARIAVIAVDTAAPYYYTPDGANRLAVAGTTRAAGDVAAANAAVARARGGGGHLMGARSHDEWRRRWAGIGDLLHRLRSGRGDRLVSRDARGAVWCRSARWGDCGMRRELFRSGDGRTARGRWGEREIVGRCAREIGGEIVVRGGGGFVARCQREERQCGCGDAKGWVTHTFLSEGPHISTITGRMQFPRISNMSRLFGTTLASGVAVLVMLAGCGTPERPVSLAQRVAAERAIKSEVVAAYDFTRPHVAENLMSLYAPDGPVLSASGGRVTTTRDSLRMGIAAFWDNVGRNMREPHVEWTSMRIDVLSPTSAVMTATYRIPHKTPAGLPHVIGGAWTAAFVLREGRWVIVQEHLSDNPYAS